MHGFLYHVHVICAAKKAQYEFYNQGQIFYNLQTMLDYSRW
jgi:hypothetical protein